MLTLYVPRNSWLHRLPAGAKFLALIGVGTAIFWVPNIEIMAGVALISCLLFASAKIPLMKVYDQLKPAFWALLIIFLAQWYLEGLEYAGYVTLRFTALILLASLLTLTTRSDAMIAVIEKALRPFDRWISVEKVSLAFSLTLRFIPLMRSVTAEVREAQKARGLDRSLIALMIPVIIRTLKTATEVGEAVEARMVDND
ncbi:MAG: energy-coupling factor transporter transmembrane protein EcfT [Sneathiella sp.]|nr:energy-coupling factor transporter transmembrane protein EcfT [Sneathiella sp.]